MQPPQTRRLGDLQLKIMKVLWDRSAASVWEVQEALASESGLAYTTVATMLRKMEARRLVRHRSQGRRFIYEPAVTADEVTRNMADDVLERLFDGSLASMVHHLLRARDVSRRELAELEKMIQARKRETR
jgi:predicted transcriptional regulator